MIRNADMTTGDDVRQCLLCGGTRHRAIFDDFGVDVLRCIACGHVFSSFPADPNYGGFWGKEVTGDDHFYWCQARNRTHREFVRRFLEGRSGRLLDVGCGLGFFLKVLSREPNWEGHGCEISPAAVRFGSETLGLRKIRCGSLEDVGYPEGFFDLITMWDVLEHFVSPDPLLRRCNALLRDGGACFIYTPNVRLQLARARCMKWLRRTKPGVTFLQARNHLHLYSMAAVQRLLARNGFSEVEFLHLPTVQSVSGSRSRLLSLMKDVYFGAARALAIVSGGRVNMDNLFVVARKSPRAAGAHAATGFGRTEPDGERIASSHVSAFHGSIRSSVHTSTTC